MYFSLCNCTFFGCFDILTIEIMLKYSTFIKTYFVVFWKLFLISMLVNLAITRNQLQPMGNFIVMIRPLCPLGGFLVELASLTNSPKGLFEGVLEYSTCWAYFIKCIHIIHTNSNLSTQNKIVAKFISTSNVQFVYKLYTFPPQKAPFRTNN